MKATAFDGIARNVGEGTSRRQFLHLLGGAVAAGIGAAAMGEPVSAGILNGKRGGRRKNRNRRKNQVCASWIISGGPNATDQLGVDDDLQITLNGVAILNDANKAAGNLPPVPFQAKEGDSLGVIATDVHASCRTLSPLWLHCATSGQKRQLSAGQPDGCAAGRSPGVFFNQVFKVKL